MKKYSAHPAWLKAGGKPVVFVYARALNDLKLPGWQSVVNDFGAAVPGGATFIGDRISAEAARVFDGIHTYNPTGLTKGKTAEEIRAWARTTYPEWVKTAGSRISCVTVIPGYDDSCQPSRKPPRPITDRHGGATYTILWEQAIAANPDWVLITSWNEWHEGSEIEPSVEDGDLALRNTRTYAMKFRGRAAAP
jgi:glycoprotein endo-alpha-1,2-mannosidase